MSAPLARPTEPKPLKPTHTIDGDPGARVYVGDCRQVLPRIPECAAGKVDLVFADPPFNWKRGYDEWDDNMPEDDYLGFTYDWLDLCIKGLRPGGALWVNIPDDWAAEIVCYMKGRLDRRPPGVMHLMNWCIWHYRFGQNATEKFINSKVHVLYFTKWGGEHTWNPKEVLEISDRRSIYFDARTESKRDGMPAGHRLPMDVWYGKFWGRVQGYNKERRGYHDNQLPEVYLERVIRATSNPGDLVIDPFLGSGTTGVMAHALKRRFIGVEFSAANAKSAYERMQAGPIRTTNGEPQSTAIFGVRRRTARGKGVTDAERELRVKVVPGSRRDEIAGMLGDRLKVRVSAPPEGGKANKAVCALVAGALGIKPRQVEVIAGHASPEKTLRVSGAAPAALARLLGGREPPGGSLYHPSSAPANAPIR